MSINIRQLKKSDSTAPVQQKSAFFSPSGEGSFFSSTPAQRKQNNQSQIQKKSATSPMPVVQNKQEPLQRKEEGGEQESSVQMKGKLYSGGAGSAESGDTNVVQGKLNNGPLIPTQLKRGRTNGDSGGGAKKGSSGMPEHVQSGMEKLFQTSFAGIKIHQDSAKASQMGALAYTQGKDIHFASGQYNPDTKDGRTLLGHELRHVQQQSAGQVKPTTEIGGMPVNDDKGLEADADRWGDKAGAMKMDGGPMSGFKPQSMPFNTGAGLAQAKMKSLGNGGNGTIQAKMAGGGGAGSAAGGSGKKGGGKGGGGKSPNVDASQQYLKDLTGKQPADFVKEMNMAGGKMSGILSGEKQGVEQVFPEVEQPTGIEAKTNSGNAGKGGGKSRGKESGGGDSPLGKKVKKNIGKKFGKSASPRKRGGSTGGKKGGGGFMSRFKKKAKSIAKSAGGNKTTKVGDETINIGAGTPPKVDLSGQADPSQMDQEMTTNTTHVERDLTSFNQESQKDYGEKDIFPDVGDLKLMKPEVAIPPAPDIKMKEIGQLAEVEPEILGGFNAEAQAFMDEKVAAEMANNDAAVSEMNATADAEWATYEEQMKTETDKVSEQQKAAKKKAEEAVGQHKKSWKKENDKLKQEFKTQADQQQSEMKGQIDSQVQEANQQADSELKKAESEAQAEADKAQADAKAKEQEAEEKKKGGGLFGKIKNAVKGALNWLKDQFNKIVNKLKDLVNQLIEKAKALATQLIEKARSFVVGLIEKFANYLKQLADKYLAKFPMLRDKFKALIDKAVTVATEAVNKLAKKLEQFVHQLLDQLGAKLIALIDKYAAYIKGAFAVLDLLAGKLFEVLEGLANLAKSAKNSPGQFVGQMSEEVLGTDVTQPLPNERPSPETATPEQIGQAAELSGMPPEDVSFLKKDSYADGDFQAEQVMDGGQMPAGLMDIINTLGEGEHEFAADGAADNSLEALKAEMLGVDPGAAKGILDGQAGDDGGAVPMKQAAPGPQATGGEGDGLVGPFKSPAERAAYLVKEMGKKVKEWFNKNKGKIIAGLVGGLAGFVVLNILSGGAVMAALPLIMQIFSSVMLAKDMATMTGFVSKYLTAAWPGDIPGGAKNLARAFAIAAVEVATTLIFGPGKALKGAKSAAKTASEGGVKGLAKMGMNSAVDSAKGTAKAAKDLAKVTKEGAQTTLKNGKAIMKGLKNGDINVKSMKALGKSMAKMRFKKFKVSVKGLKFKLMGKINPWVELASGDLKKVDDAAVSGKAAGDLVKYTDEAGELVEGTLIDASKLGTGGDLVKALPGKIKKSHDQLMDAGLKVMEEGGVIKYFDESGHFLAEVSDGAMKFKYKGFAGDVVMDPNKPTTVLGKFVQDWQNPSRHAGTSHFLGTNATTPKIEGFPDGSFTRGAGKNAEAGSMNFLDIPEPEYNTLINKGIKEELAKHGGGAVDLTTQSVKEVETILKKELSHLGDDQIKAIIKKGQDIGNGHFWTECNAPFLEDAFKRGDNIRLVSDPKTMGTGFYGKELDLINKTLAPKYGYVYNPIMGAFIKAE